MSDSEFTIMNILLLVAEFPPTIGGLANYSYNIAKGLKKNNGVNISVSPGDLSSKKYVVNVQYIIGVNKRIKRLKKAKDVDIVYTIAFRPQFSVIGLYAKILNLPFVSHGVGLDTYTSHPFYVLTRKTAYSISDQLICGANFQKEIMFSEGAPGEKIHVILGGVDRTIFRPRDNQRDQFRRFLNVEDKFVLLSLGRLIRRKGFDDAIRALTYLDDIKDILLLIVGDGPEKPFLTELVDVLHLKEKVKFLGFVPSDHIPKFYNIANLFIAPFRIIGRDLESFPLVVLEAQACGVPVISTNTAGVPELVENRKSGFIVQMNSPKEIAEKIRILHENPKLSYSMAKNAQKRTERFDWPVVITKIEDVLQTTLTQR